MGDRMRIAIRRLWARVIDYLICAVLTLPLGYPMGWLVFRFVGQSIADGVNGFARGMGPEGKDAEASLALARESAQPMADIANFITLMMAVVFLATITCYELFFVLRGRRTPGKALLRLTVRNTSTWGRAGGLRALWRTVLLYGPPMTATIIQLVAVRRAVHHGQPMDWDAATPWPIIVLYVFPLAAFLLSCVVPERALHDLLAGTRVER
ncbi:RDD family protein [Streptomyces sp. NPDC057939]|uniref:RDD family protein n=1 Tax=Streptomyces sp. NPDC057939 TaxID=3346284 RepID=UPI0036E458DC